MGFGVHNKKWKFSILGCVTRNFNICVCVSVIFWPPVNITCLNYEVVGFQPQAVDMTSPRICLPSLIFQYLPTSKTNARHKTKRTKERQWSHYYLLQLFSKPNEVKMAETLDK